MQRGYAVLIQGWTGERWYGWGGPAADAAPGIRAFTEAATPLVAHSRDHFMSAGISFAAQAIYLPHIVICQPDFRPPTLFAEISVDVLVVRFAC